MSAYVSCSYTSDSHGCQVPDIERHAAHLLVWIALHRARGLHQCLASEGARGAGAKVHQRPDAHKRRSMQPPSEVMSRPSSVASSPSMRSRECLWVGSHPNSGFLLSKVLKLRVLSEGVTSPESSGSVRRPILPRGPKQPRSSSRGPLSLRYPLEYLA
jgi:hypothetical protein